MSGQSEDRPQQTDDTQQPRKGGNLLIMLGITVALALLIALNMN